MPEGVDWLGTVNPKSLEVVRGAKLEPSLAAAPPGDRVQFERVGYFVADARGPRRRHARSSNRTVTLRDTWAKLQKQEAKPAWGSGVLQTGFCGARRN